MKVFMLVSRVPWPLEKGDKLRAYHQLKNLARDHEVFLCCLNDGKLHPQAYEQLLQITPHVKIIQLNKLLIVWRLILGFFSSKPFQVNYFFQNGAASKVKKYIAEFKPDHLYCQLIRTSEYVKNYHNYRKTIDYMDALSTGLSRREAGSSIFMKYFVREEAARLRNYEHLIFDYFDHHTIISAQDQQLIFHPDRNKIVVVPNGIDTEFFHKSNKAVRDYDLLFTGNMSYPPNVDCALRMVKEIFPAILKSRPQTRLLIAGANPSQSIKDLRSESVSVSGWMDDIRDAYNNATMFVAPMRIGSGLQNKLLEAMAMELPCITSSLVAGGLKAKDHVHLMVEDDNQKFAELVLNLLNDQAKSTELGMKGKGFVLENYNWTSSTAILSKVFNN
jgi:polysaccharide biosynthesis protein PslH